MLPALTFFFFSSGKWVNFRSFPPSIFVIKMICPAWWEKCSATVKTARKPVTRNP